MYQGPFENFFLVGNFVETDSLILFREWINDPGRELKWPEECAARRRETFKRTIRPGSRKAKMSRRNFWSRTMALRTMRSAKRNRQWRRRRRKSSKHLRQCQSHKCMKFNQRREKRNAAVAARSLSRFSSVLSGSPVFCAAIPSLVALCSCGSSLLTKSS